MNRVVAVVSMLLIQVTVGCSSDSSKSALRINEIVAATDKPYDDWLELYNASDGDVSLAGYELRDDSSFWRLPGGTIQAGGFHLVICDGSGKGGKASFKLDAGGETVSIYDEGGAMLDSVTFPKLAKMTSWGRIPDGDGSWTRLGKPTPGAANVPGAPPDGGLPDQKLQNQDGAARAPDAAGP